MVHDLRACHDRAPDQKMKLEHFSASRRTTFEQCQLKYHAIYELGMESPKHPLTNMGSALHLMFEKATDAIIKKEAEPLTDPFYYKSEAVREFGVNLGDIPVMDKLAQNALDWGYFRDARPIVGAELEVDFMLPDGITKVTGYIDRLDFWKGAADVKDLKTQRKEFDEDKLNNNWQARIYNIGARMLVEGISSLSVSFWVLRHRVQRVWLTEADSKAGILLIQEAADEIRNCENPVASPSALCPYCPLYKQCDAHRKGVKQLFNERMAKVKPKEKT